MACALSPETLPPTFLRISLQRGAAVDLQGTVHEEEEHLERPLLTAALRSDLPMMRLLVQVGVGAVCGWLRMVWVCGWSRMVCVCVCGCG